MTKIIAIILIIGSIFRPIQTKSFLDVTVDTIHAFAGTLFQEAEKTGQGYKSVR